MSAVLRSSAATVVAFGVTLVMAACQNSPPSRAPVLSDEMDPACRAVIAEVLASTCGDDGVAWYTPVGCFNDAYAVVINIDDGCYSAYKIEADRSNTPSLPKPQYMFHVWDSELVGAFLKAQRVLKSAVAETGPLRRIDSGAAGRKLVFVGAHPMVFAMNSDTPVADAFDCWQAFNAPETNEWEPASSEESARDWAIIFARASEAGRVEFAAEILNYIDNAAWRIYEARSPEATKTH